MKKIYFIPLVLSIVSEMYAQIPDKKSKELNLIPLPQEIRQDEGSFIINPQTVIISSDAFNGSYLKEKIDKATGYDLAVQPANRAGKNPVEDNYILLDISSAYGLPEQGYELEVTPEKIIARASDRAGSFYAVQTLLQLLPPSIYGSPTGFESWEIPVVSIKDYPRFKYRGMMLDVSRTFFEKEVLYKYIDWLAYHKMNAFHWHLADDNGWRIEIKKYPFLTQKGAWRGPDEVIPATFGSGNKRYGGYYTQEEVKDLIAYAAQRNIEIIPEIDLPGHSNAAIGSYPGIACDIENQYQSVQGETGNVWCVGNEENYKMLDGIFKELAELFPGKYIHIGGDEVNMQGWKECEKCRALMKREGMKEEKELLGYFVGRIEKILAKYGKCVAGWDDILDRENLEPTSRVYAWRSIEKGIEAVTKGQPTVMQVASYYYLDMNQSPMERGHNWAGIVPLKRVYDLDPEEGIDSAVIRKNPVLGIQVGLFTELLNKPPRFIEYQTFPRICAASEAGWTAQKTRNWDDFYYRLTKTHFNRLYEMGIAFRIPYPEVRYERNILKIKPPYPWAVIRYTTDGTDPVPESDIYTGDIVTYEPENFRFAVFFKDRFKSLSVGAENIALHTYKKPATEIETNLPENKSFPLSNLSDYNFKTYFRSERKAGPGDYLVYKFKEPVSCKSVTVETGIPDIDFYGVTDGYIEYSYDGTVFIKGDEFKDNKAVIYPDKPLKSVKIVITAPNDGYNLSLQDLKIE